LKAAYIDTSCILAVYFEEPRYRGILDTLLEYEEIFSSNLLEAELRAVLLREGFESSEPELLKRFIWVLPGRALSREIKVVLSKGYLRGADLWHLACALFLRDSIGAVEFVSLDRKQVRVARDLAFDVAAWG